MALPHWFKTAAALAACAAAAAGAAAVWSSRGTPGAAAPAAADPEAVVVEPGPLRVAVEAPGVLEAARTADVFCPVEGQTSIIRVVPEGTFVTRGELVCELDGAAIRDQLVNQEIVVRAAEADFRNAGFAREAAADAAAAYEQGEYRLEAERLRGELVLAQSALKLAELRRVQVDRELKRLNAVLAEKRGGPPAAEVDYGGRRAAADAAVAVAKRNADNAANQQKLLDTLVRPRQVKELASAAEQAASDVQVRQAVVETEKAREAKLRAQLAKCRIVAPADGLVLLANGPGEPGGQDGTLIEDGATVRERQKILSIAEPGGPMRVQIKVAESLADRVSPGLRARIEVDASKGGPLFGEVESVAALPDAPGQADQPRVYSAAVAVEGGHPGLRPGMSAWVEILVVDLDDVLTVPLSAVARVGGRDRVSVKTPGGGVAWRNVVLGATDGKTVEVRSGLRAGERVVLPAASDAAAHARAAGD